MNKVEKWIKAISQNTWLTLGSFWVIALGLYASVLFAPFLYDDHEFIVNNPLARNFSALVAGWHEASTKWVTYLTFVMNYHWSGENVLGYHLFNLLLHGVNAGLLYRLVRWIFQSPRLKDSHHAGASGIAFLTALIFLVHPFQTESVSYLWQRSELLNAFFYLAALNVYFWARLSKKSIGYLAVAALFGVGFYTKGMIVSLPLLLVAIEDAWFDVPQSRRLSLWVARGIVYGCILWIGFAPLIAFNFQQVYSALIVFSGAQLAHYHLFLQADALARLILLALVPIYQNVDHTLNPHWYFFQPNVILPFIFLGLLGLSVVWFWNRSRMVAFGVILFFVLILPSSLLGGREPMVEHRLYLPLAGIALVISVGIQEIYRRRTWGKWVMVAVVLVYALLTIARNQVWRSEQALFEDTVKKSPGKARPALMLGTVYMTQKRYEDAYRFLTRAVQLDPKSVEALNNLGYLMQAVGYGMDAENYYEKALLVNPKFGPACINLGYMALGMGDDDRAWELFNRAIQGGSQESGEVGLGNVCTFRGQFPQARQHFKNVLRANPNHQKAKISLDQLKFFD